MGCQFQPGNDWEQLLGWGSPRCIEMHLFIGMSLIWPNFIVTILHIGFQPCPTFIRVNRCALVHPKIIQQYRETNRKSRLQALAKPKYAARICSCLWNEKTKNPSTCIDISLGTATWKGKKWPRSAYFLELMTKTQKTTPVPVESSTPCNALDLFMSGAHMDNT